MAHPQEKSDQPKSINRRPLRRHTRSLAERPFYVDSSTLASKMQIREEQRELTYSIIALFVKSGLLIIAIASSFKLGLASHQRINRNMEISSALRVENNKLARLQRRFDSLFSIGGKARLMEEQDQWIVPNSRRVIWR